MQKEYQGDKDIISIVYWNHTTKVVSIELKYDAISHRRSGYNEQWMLPMMDCKLRTHAQTHTPRYHNINATKNGAELNSKWSVR